jgi:hypothetical protein
MFYKTNEKMPCHFPPRYFFLCFWMFLCMGISRREALCWGVGEGGVRTWHLRGRDGGPPSRTKSPPKSIVSRTYLKVSQKRQPPTYVGLCFKRFRAHTHAHAHTHLVPVEVVRPRGTTGSWWHHAPRTRRARYIKPIEVLPAPCGVQRPDDGAPSLDRLEWALSP